LLCEVYDGPLTINDGKFTITGYSHDTGTCHSISKVRLIGGDPVQTAIETRACEGSSVSLSCDSGYIDIIDATYGRKHGPDVCPHSATSDQDCHAASSVAIVSAACTGQTSCEVSATNGIFGDPCGGTYKYLTGPCDPFLGIVSGHHSQYHAVAITARMLTAMRSRQ
jgi:hypothetical protein